MSDYGQWVGRAVNERLVMEVAGRFVIWPPYMPLPFPASLGKTDAATRADCCSLERRL